jgi:hypothetical protein
MNFYQVPITALFTQNATAPVSSKSSNLILDQRRISESSDIKLIGIKRMITYICAKRRDWNGEVLSLRSDDLNFLALMLDKSPEATIEYLESNQYLFN